MSKRANGEGSIYQRKSDGKWCWSLRQKNCRPIILYADSQQEIIAKRNDWFRTHTIVEYKQSDMLFDDLFTDFMEKHKQHVSQHTYELYKKLYRVHIKPYLGIIQINKLDIKSIKLCLDSANLSNASKKLLRIIINLALDFAVENDLILKNPACKAPKYKIEKKIINLPSEEIIFQIIEDTPKYYHSIFKLLYDSGARIGEVLALEKANISYEKDHIKITINKSRGYRDVHRGNTKTPSSFREVLLPPRAKAYLDEFKESTQYALGQNIGQAILATFKASAKRHGYPNLRIHDLRHAHVTKLIMLGVPLEIISKRIGHKSIKTTYDTYGHLKTDAQKQIIGLI